MIVNNQTNLQRRFIDTYNLNSNQKLIVCRLESKEAKGSLNTKIVAVYLHKGDNGIPSKVYDFTSKNTINFIIAGYPGRIFYLNNGGGLAWTPTKRPLKNQEDIHTIRKNTYPEAVLFTQKNAKGGTSIRCRILNENELIDNNGYYSLYNNLCNYCQNDYVKKQMLSTLIGLLMSGVTLPSIYNFGTINSYQDFLRVITHNLPNNQKIDFLNKVIQYGAATPQERGIATEWLKYLTNQQQLYPFNQNMINQYQNQKTIYPQNYNNAKNMQPIVLPDVKLVNWTHLGAIKLCNLYNKSQTFDYTVTYGDLNGQKYFLVRDANNNQVSYNRCNNRFKCAGISFHIDNEGGLFYYNGGQFLPYSANWTPMQNYQTNNKVNECIIKRNYNSFGNNNQNNNNLNNVFTTTLSDYFFGTINVTWRRNGSKACIMGLTVNGSVIDKNQLQQLTKSYGLLVSAIGEGNFACIKFKNNNTLEIYDDKNQVQPLRQTNLLQQQVQNFNANNFNQQNALNNCNYSVKCTKT